MIYNLQQMSANIIIGSLLVATALAVSSLTTNNCPTSFDINTHNNSLSSTNANLAASLYGGILSSEMELSVTTAIENGDIYSIKDLMLSTSFLAPYIIILVIFWVLFLTVVCCSLFERRCPPCKSWRRNYVKEPYSNCERRVTLTFGLLFSAGILVCTIVVFSSFTTLKSDIDMVQCGIYYSLDVATNGEQSRSWGGFGQVQSQLSSISGLIDSTSVTVNNSLYGNDWIKTGFQSLQNMNLNLYTSNQNSAVLSPNPTTTYNAMSALNPLPTIVPRFIQSGLGPNGTANTMVTDIDSSFRITQKLTDQAWLVYRSGMTFVSSSANITANTNSNLNAITRATDLLGNIKIAVDLFTTSYLKFFTSYGIYMMEAAFGIILLAALISLLGMISSHIFDLFACRKMVNGGWCLFGLIYFAVLGTMLFFMIVGSVSHIFCNYFQTVISSQSSFLSYSMKSDSNAVNHLFQYLDVCFFGDGNILKKFYVAEEMSTVQQLFTHTQTFIDMQTVGNSQYVDLNIPTGKVLGWITAMSQYGLGVYRDDDPTVTTQDNPYVSLANFNLLTLKYNTTGTLNLCTNDLWVFNALNCSNSSSQSLYVPSADTTNGLFFPSSGSLCISLNSNIWTASKISQRYILKRSCDNTVAGNSTTAYSEVRKYAQSITNYRDSKYNLYQSISSELSTLQLTISAYNNNMSLYYGSVNTLFSSVATLNNLVTNQINGLTLSANCTYIADSFRFFYNMYCVNYANRSIKIVISCMAMLVLMVGGVVVGGIFGVRFQRIEKEVRLTRVEQTQSQQFRMQESVVTEDSEKQNSEEQN